LKAEFLVQTDGSFVERIHQHSHFLVVQLAKVVAQYDGNGFTYVTSCPEGTTNDERILKRADASITIKGIDVTHMLTVFVFNHPEERVIRSVTIGKLFELGSVLLTV